MFKQLLRDASLYSLSTLLARGFSFITVPVFTRILSPADYGALDLLSYAAVLAPLVIGAGLDQAVGRYYLDSSLDEEERRRIASTGLFYNLIAFAVVGLLLAPAADFLARGWLAGQVGPGTVQIVLVFMWIQSIFYITNNQLRYLFRARAFALSNVGNTVLSTASSFAAIVWLDLGVAGVFLGQAFGQLVFSVVSIWLARDCYRAVFDLALLRRMLVYSLPLVPGTLAFFVMQYVDRYVLNDARGLAEVGIYGMGARIASLVNLFLMGFQGAWWPHVMSAFREPDAPGKFRKVAEVYLLVTMAILVLLSLFGHEVLLLLTTPEFAAGYVVVPLLVLGAVMASVANYFSYGIQIAEKNHYRMLLNLGALVAAVGLNLLLVPALGVVGAALANALCFVALAAGSLAVSQRLYHVPYAWPRLLAGLAIGIAVSHAVIFWEAPVSLLMLVVKGALAALAITLTALVLGVPLRPREWRRIAGL
ncbi:MAG: polysaccharide biosynthesis protein [Chromatiales bacterium]|nr:polysaccharide biosynthesis protein [Chromatiales bacterium]